MSFITSKGLYKYVLSFIFKWFFHKITLFFLSLFFSFFFLFNLVSICSFNLWLLFVQIQNKIKYYYEFIIFQIMSWLAKLQVSENCDSLQKIIIPLFVRLLLCRWLLLCCIFFKCFFHICTIIRELLNFYFN